MLAPSWRCVLYGHITKTGDPVLRSILIQCARTGIKSDKRLKEFYMRIKHKGEKKAIIAVARKIVVYA
jgi:transposase